MKNLKRTLCLALSVIMLLGMMMISSGAASFTDADQIVNTEAVEITAGLGLFAGTSDGRFDPKGTVTRAQMATIIVKMRNGSTFNADAFKGVNTFSDTAAFEGGWAEGYINACAQMGVVSGYGDGTYKPGKELTTAEAVTMIINALKVDAGKGEWPLTVMAKAEQMKLFSELKTKPNTNDALSRDDLASIVLQGLKYSPSNSSGYEVTVGGKNVRFTEYAEALQAAASMGLDATAVRENVGEDTLANKTFEMKTVSGFIMENQATGEEYTYLDVDNTEYDVETGLDSIGHFVTIYYKDLAKESYKEVYCVVDECEVVTLTEDATVSKDYKAAFGRSTKLAGNLYVFDGEYDLLYDEDAEDALAEYVAGTAAPAGIYVVYENEVISYVVKPEPVATYVVDIDKDADKGQIWLSGLNQGLSNVEGDDVVTEYPGIAVKDYVTYTVARGQYVLHPVDPVSGTITKTYTNSDGVAVINIGGVDYEYFGGTNNSSLAYTINNIDYDVRYTLYVTEDGKFVGYEKADGAVNVADVAYVLGAFQITSTDEFGAKARSYYAQGVNTAGKEVRYLMGVEYDTNQDDVYGGEGDDETLGVTTDTLAEGWYNTKESTDRDEKKAGIQLVEEIGKTYDEDDNPLFWGANRWITTGTTTISYTSGMVYSTVHTCTEACTATKHVTSAPTAVGYYGSNTKFLIIDGTLGSQLTCSMIPKSSIKYTTSSANGDKAMGFNMLLSKDENKNTQVELVVMKKTASQMTTGTNLIYVAASQLESTGRTSSGYSYEVYVATTGKVQTMITNEESVFPTEPGFYNYELEDDGTVESFRAIEPTEDNYLYPGVVFDSVYGGVRMSVTKLAGAAGSWTPSGDSTSGAPVIDARTEDEIDASGVSEVTSVERINSLSNTSHKFVTMDIAGKSGSAVGAIYVTGVYTAPIIPETVFIDVAPKANSVVEVRTMDGEYKKIYISKASNLAGYVSYYLDGEDAVIGEATDIFTGEITKSMLNGNVLTVNGDELDISNANFVDYTPNGIATASQFATALNGAGVNSVTCSVVPNSAGTAASEIVITDADVDDGETVENFTINKNGHIFFIPGLPGDVGYGADEGDAWLIYESPNLVTPKKVHISWTATQYSGENRFYRTVNTTDLYSSPLSSYSGYYAYKTAYHNLITSMTLDGNTYSVETVNAPEHSLHPGWSNSTGTSTDLRCNGEWEAPLNITFSTSTRVIDVRRGAIPGLAKVMSAADLMERVNSGEEIMISYYCHRADVTSSAQQETDKENKPATAVANVIFITD